MELKSQYISEFYDIVALSKQKDEAIFNHILLKLEDVILHSNDEIKSVDREKFSLEYLEYDSKEGIRIQKVLNIKIWLNNLFQLFFASYTKEFSLILKNSVNEEKNTARINISTNLIYGKLREVRHIELQKKWKNYFDEYYNFINDKYLSNINRNHSFCFNHEIVNKIANLFDEYVGDFIHDKTKKEDFVKYFEGYIPKGCIYFTDSSKFIYHFIKSIASKAKVSKHWKLLGDQKKIYFVSGKTNEIIDEKFVHSSKLSTNDQTKLKKVMDYFN